MTHTPLPLPDPTLDADLMAYVDGKLSPEDAARIEAQLMQDAPVQAQVTGWQRQRTALRDAADLLDTGPRNLVTARLERDLAAQLRKRQLRALLWSPRLRDIAAGVVLFAAGWGTNSYLESRQQTSLPGYVTQAFNAHGAHGYDTLQPAHLTPDQMDAALDWMSDKLQMKLNDPGLERAGLSLQYARLVETGTGPLALFTYEDSKGERLTLSITPHPVAQPDHGLRILRRADQRVAYWSANGFDYSVTGRVEPGAITSIAASLSR